MNVITVIWWIRNDEYEAIWGVYKTNICKWPFCKLSLSKVNAITKFSPQIIFKERGNFYDVMNREIGSFLLSPPLTSQPMIFLSLIKIMTTMRMRVFLLIITIKMTGGTSEVRSDKSVTFGPMELWTNRPTDQSMVQWTTGPMIKIHTMLSGHCWQLPPLP